MEVEEDVVLDDQGKDYGPELDLAQPWVVEAAAG